MTRRSRLVVAAAVVTAAALTLIAGVSVPGAGAAASGARPRTNGGTMRMQMPMSGAHAAAATSAPATVELHRSEVHVTILNFAFMPKHLVVSPGTRVVWTNKDSEPHTVTSDRPAFQSEAINTDGHYTLVARRIGTFTYHCQIHPFMHGALVVKG